MITALTRLTPDVLRDRLIASRAAQYVAEQEAGGVLRAGISAEASSIIARLVATDAVIAELAARRVELVTRFRTLLAERLADDRTPGSHA